MTTYTATIDEPAAGSFRVTFARADGGHRGAHWFTSRYAAEKAAADFSAHLEAQRLEMLATPSFWSRGVHS
jgi:hypothetical protein